MQCEIIEELWDPATGRLVICGDTKQSIYAWRNADPKVMPDLEHEIQTTARHRKVALRASYRSKDSILDFVNALFKQVYGESYADDEMLVPAKEKNAVLPRREGKTVRRVSAGAVGGRKFQVPGFKFQVERAADHGRAQEIPKLEDRVKAGDDGGRPEDQTAGRGPDSWQTSYRYSDDTERFEPVSPSNKYRYSDILILLRRTTNQQVLEHVLRIQGIPYRIGGRGKGLFTRPEVIDTLLFLKVLTQPFDTISLIGFLRSPWVGLSDDSILQLGWKDSSFDEALFSKMVLSADGEKRLSGEQAQRLGRARQFIAEFRSKTGYCLASEILRELIQRTGYDAVISGTFRGTQRIANLRKLIDWIRRAERGGTVLLADVVKTLEEYADNPPDIPEAALLDPEQNAVTIMTIHGAKGLDRARRLRAGAVEPAVRRFAMGPAGERDGRGRRPLHQDGGHRARGNSDAGLRKGPRSRARDSRRGIQKRVLRGHDPRARPRGPVRRRRGSEAGRMARRNRKADRRQRRRPETSQASSLHRR